MWIERIAIKGFGCLSGRSYEFPKDRAVLVIENNETGKSTLAAALLAGLCGFPRRKRKGEQMKLADVYDPWDGGDYSIEMDLEAAGQRLRVERDFRKGSFVIRDRETNKDISSRFDSDLAQHFPRLPRDDFERVAFICGKQVAGFSSSATIQARLSAAVEGSADDSGADLAISRLDGTRYAVDDSSPLLIGNAISRLTASIGEKQRAMDALDESLDSDRDQTEQFNEATTCHKELAARLDALDAEYRCARLREVRDRIKAAESAEREVAELREEMHALEDYSTFPAERKAQLDKATARLHDRQAQVDKLRAKSRTHTAEADEIRIRLDALPQFALAADDDLVALGTAEESVGTARAELDERRKETAKTKHTSRSTGRALALTGGLLSAASLALMALSIMAPLQGMVGTATGLAVMAAGLILYFRAAAAGAGARARLEQAEALLQKAQERAARLLSGLQVACDESALEDVLARTKGALSRYFADRAKLREVESDIAELSREADYIKRGVRDEEATISSILSDAGIDASLPLEEATRKFEEARAQYDRYRQISDALLPTALKYALSSDNLAKLRAEDAELAAQVDSTGSSTVRASSDVETERQGVRNLVDEALAQVRELEKSVGALVDTYRRKYPLLQEDMRALRKELEKVARFGEALDLAKTVMREVSESSHRRWAAALNAQASTILPHLNPDYTDLRFDDSLGFTIRHIADNRIIEKDEIDARLSTGAKDQVYLAVRLACCRELARGGEPTPIILDDPLIASDDTRFRSGLRYLVETLAKEQQVVILSCHKSRHESLCSEAWFADNVTVVEM